MIQLREDEFGHDTTLVYLGIGSCMSVTAEVADELAGAHLPHGVPERLDALLERLQGVVGDRPIEGVYLVGAVPLWKEYAHGDQYKWPEFITTVKAKLAFDGPAYS